ncbi:nitrate- and nitrite sensing domain-containing protein [Streptomyces sp. NBC_00094]|uniref:sensor histidine kinase n=1 Tax=Streptomyces sp. NBC_00094 TaxID=2903620 RepID=UPI0022516B99|nr:nitrate- and nitrite sensing domain-containing protein [Streptomyces sp. NBC_00094]MCX5395118.1 nitrate- and nitrite sensing domain-containing protein [Streptomyces sp. NBC_00094]
MRTPRKTKDAEATAPPPAAARGRRAHAGPPADEPGPHTPEAFPTTGRTAGQRTPAPGTHAAGTHAVGTPGARTPVAPRGGRATRHGLRPRTVRAKIVSLLMVPVVSLLALWGFATVTTAQDVARLRQLQRVDAEIREPVTAAIDALQAERRAAVRQVAAPGTARTAELKDRIRRTDAALDRLRLDGEHTVGDTGDLPGDVPERVGAFVGTVEGLARLRTAAVDGRADGDQVYEEYTAAVSAGFAVGGSLTGIQDPQQGSDARVLLEFGRAGEMLSREDALLGSAHLTGRLTPERLRAFAGAVETRRTLIASATVDLPADARAAWDRLAAGRDHTLLVRAEDRVLAAAAGRPAAQAVTSAEWDDTSAAVRSGLTAIETDARGAAADRADPFAGGVLSMGGAAVLLGLAAVAASLVISVRIGRGLVVELVSLRNTALGIARRKLPAAMRRLRAGEEIDVQAEAPPGPDSQDEIGQVGEALTTVHRAALSAAVERAELASGISGVFVNLARRSQVLVHRQLNLLDSMERRADDPNELGDLFRLDHLTTRMRRHAESLIILSGAAPGRAWRMPVPLTNVVRAAVSEIEDYARVEVRRLPETAVVGGAVADLTHLLAELIENAAQFSPPHTKVRVSGEPVGNGYALEIEDRGLGMGKETLAEANARIAQSEALDLFDSDRLGLFVVSRLSSRHDIKVQLRTSPYGGTTAVVLLPTDVLQGALPPGRGTQASTGPGADGAQSGTPAANPGPQRAPADVSRGRDPRSGDSRGGDPRTDASRSGDPRVGGAVAGAARAAREHEEAQRAEARRFGRPQGPRTPTPTLPLGPTAAPRSTTPQQQAGPQPLSRPQPTDRPRPQSLPRPTVVPALAAGPEQGPPPPGVTALRPRGASVPTSTSATPPPAQAVPTPPPAAPVAPTPPRPRTPAPAQPPTTPAAGAGPYGPYGNPGGHGDHGDHSDHGGHGDHGDPEGDLPRRVRQASLVPQLREAPVPDPVSVPAAPGADARTPEQVRDRMAAYRDGWQRGGGPAPGSRRPLGAGFDGVPRHAAHHEPHHDLDDPLAPRFEGDDA